MVRWSTRFADSDLSLCGCGFLCIYHAGVCAALKEYAPQLTQNRIYGASAGSIAAAGLICNVSISDATCAIMRVVAEARSRVLQSFDPAFDLLGIVREVLNKLLPANSHVLCTDRLFISLTRCIDGRNVLVSKFESKADLIQAIICSCYIPIFCGLVEPEFHGVKYRDGGFSDNQPVYDRNTITISPFSGEADICPLDHASASILGFVYYGSSIRFTNENFYRFCSCFFPPSQEICSKICRQGFTDALRFITKNSITPCYRCLGHGLHDFKQKFPRIICRRASSTANNPNALMRRRKKLDSECEICYAWLDRRLSIELTSALIPEVLHKSLQGERAVSPNNSSSSLFDFVGSFRLIRFWLDILGRLVYYADLAINIFFMLNQWFLNAPKCGLFILQQLCRFADALLLGVEESSLANSSRQSVNWTFTKNQNISRKIKREPNYFSIIDFDSFECLLSQLVLNELIIIEYYTSKFCNEDEYELLDGDYVYVDEPSTSKFVEQDNENVHNQVKGDNQRQLESQTNDSGISLGFNSNGSPTTNSRFSIKEGESKSKTT
uniref:PNPLA domain-containing protein n=3 Tax=Meloidogyne TaxID=189290 RepID=A0A6V7TMW6_MELEN|nr:unnamed protein product [Meloidogyne enterolobii]